MKPWLGRLLGQRAPEVTRVGGRHSMWTKESALQTLRGLTAEIDTLRTCRRFGAEHTRWRTNTLGFLEEVFGHESRHFTSFANIPWGRTGAVIVGGPDDMLGNRDPHAAAEREHQRAYVTQLDTALGLFQSAYDELVRRGLDGVYRGKNTGPEASGLLRVINLAEHKLRKVIRSPPEHERTVQEAFESLLVGAEIPYSRETEHIEYSSKTYVPDFVLPRLDLAVEIKLCARAGREREIIAEINDDILAYRTRYGNLLFVIYDTGHIRDVERFGGSLEDQSGALIRVVKQ